MSATKERKSVAVAMSGGVDSSVTAYLLLEQGFDVHGFFMRNWSPVSEVVNDCPWQEDYEDVRRVCQHLGIPYASFNFEQEYRERVLNYFFKEYQSGRTPNPDVLCNREIKFDAYLKQIKSLGFDYMATGHYAKINRTVGNEGTNNRLVKPKDAEKDQTYFLCHLSQDQLGQVLFPLGDLSKSEVREIAEQAGLPNASKKDSQGICFIGQLPVREFLKKNINLSKGPVVTSDGFVLGEHEGIELYTIGQRHIGVPTQGQHLYVIKKDPATNTIVMGPEEYLHASELRFSDASWHETLPDEFDCDVQIRYRTPLVRAKVKKTEGLAELKEKARAITAGQYVAFYNKGVLLGGAVIG